MKTYLVVGAGPAGLSAAAALSSDTDSRIILVDSGGSLSARKHDDADDLGRGVGGAGLFSDGKFSYYPSGTKLYDLPCDETLQKSYHWITSVLNSVGIETQPYPSKKDKEDSGLFSVKEYPTSYGSLAQRYALIEKLSDIRNCEFKFYSKVCKIDKHGEGKYLITLENVRSSERESLIVENIILATGRLGALEFRTMLGDLGELSSDLRYEFGLRVESRSDLGFLSKLKSPDVKAIWKTPSCEIRTFCTCRKGEVWNIPYDPLSAISGRSDGPETKFSNFGLLARFKGEHFKLGGKIFNDAMASEAISSRKVIWQSLESFMGSTDADISGSIRKDERPWYPRDRFANQSIGDSIGDQFRGIFRDVLGKLTEWSPDINDPSTAVMFPVIEGVGSYLNLTDDLRIPGENIWCCGDVSGGFRGIIPAFVSGYYIGERAMLSKQSALSASSGSRAEVELRHGVGVIIIREDKRVLIGKRKGSHGAGSWAFPGGHPREDETFFECAKREVLEETGLKVNLLIEGPVTQDVFEDIGVEYSTHFVVSKYDGGVPEVKEPEKCEEWMWASWEELCEKDSQLFKPIQSLLAQGFDIDRARQNLYEKKLEKVPFKLVTFDLDGTLVRNKSTTLYFAELLGVKDEVKELEVLFKQQLLDSTGYMNRIPEIMPGLTVDFVDRNLEGLTFIEDIAEVVSALKKNGITTIIVTTANQIFAEAIQRRFGFDFVFGTRFEIDENGRLGRGLAVCSGAHKILHVRNVATKLGVTMDQVAAVGDSLSDIQVFKKVGRSIALNYDSHLEGKADHYVKSDTLLDVLDHLCLDAGAKDSASIPQVSHVGMFHKKGGGLSACVGGSKEGIIRERLPSLDSSGLVDVIRSCHLMNINYIFEDGHYLRILPDDLLVLSVGVTGEPLPKSVRSVLANHLSSIEALKHFGKNAQDILDEISADLPSQSSGGDDCHYSPHCGGAKL